MKSKAQEKLTLLGEEINLVLTDLPQDELKFYVENPRIYSIVRPDEQSPDQQEIQSRLISMEHVKDLAQDIKQNGGLIDPIIVRDETYEVLEGNSRLAAYRLLAQKDPIKWGTIKCKLLPKATSETQVFALLGQYHIKGKTDWAPFEQAGFLYRRNKLQNISMTQLGKELNLGRTKVKQYIDTYEFMINNNETDTSRWSYYFEYLKSPKIKNSEKTMLNWTKLWLRIFSLHQL